MSFKRTLGEKYARYRVRVGRGAAYTSELEGLKNAVQGGGVILLLIKAYTGFLPPLWVLPLIWLAQKIFEYFMGWLDEKHLHWWQYENRYQTEQLNPFNKELMENVKAIRNKLD